ncbi:hypothetical protein [Cellvibrio sp. PSBB023]|uniref:hypothetical protein n=1 Tax=Cellvibrio sp. PSBB023 TaxID=1945512 RepID=UPI00098FB4B3|nr:hypothetical protein [Cellvibrio sp. PSBB023]AQT60408.1 hypothetical protein B0D95_10090 [Cellvibrio sp. PSBB023]
MNNPDVQALQENTLPLSGMDAQRNALRRQLEQQRQLLKRQWCPVDDQGVAVDRGHFPRSAAMRFLCGRKATTLLSQIVAWQFGRHYPGFAFWKDK